MELLKAEEEEKERMSPRYISPIVVWLSSPDAKDVTGRVFDVSGRMLSVSEGWHRGPSIEMPTDDPAALADFLLSDAAGWITGQVVGVDGGRYTVRSKG